MVVHRQLQILDPMVVHRQLRILDLMVVHRQDLMEVHTDYMDRGSSSPVVLVVLGGP